MSILLLTLLSLLHCQLPLLSAPPPEMFWMSLLPVANVVVSAVQKGFVASVEVRLQLSAADTFRPKSRWNAAAVNPVLLAESTTDVFTVLLALKR